jgi:protein O-GlcNAc transferase
LQQGAALHQDGRLDEAIHWYQTALEINPENATAFSNMGLALHAKGKLDEAVTSYQQAIAIKPDHAEVHSNLGIALKQQGKLTEAITSHQTAISIKPDYADAYSNLGNVLKEQGKLVKAVASYQQAIAIKPDYVDAHYNLGNILQELGKREEAVTSYQQAIAINANFVEALINLGAVLADQGKLDEAATSYQKAIAIKPDYAEAYSNLGIALKAQCKLEESISCYQKAIAIKPDYADAHSNLLLCSQFIPGQTFENLFLIHRHWSNGLVRSPDAPLFCHKNDITPERKLHIGFVSQDLGRHPVGYFLEGFLKYHPVTECIITCYSDRVPDELTKQLEGYAEDNPIMPHSVGGRTSQKIILDKCLMDTKKTLQTTTAKQSQISVDTAYKQAVDHFHAKRYIDADQLCTAIIQTQPNHIDAINLLGVIAQKVNRHDLAIEMFQRAIGINDSEAMLYYNLGGSFYQLGRRDEAVQVLATALEKYPENKQIADCLNGILINGEAGSIQDNAQKSLKRGVSFHQSGQLDQAVTCYIKAIAINSDYADAHNNLGVALQEQGKLDKAVASYLKAISVKPDYADAHNNLGVALKDQGKLDKAVASCQKAILIKPDYADAHNNLGAILKKQGKLAEAVTSHQKAITIKPDFADAYYNLGNILRDQGSLDEAISSYRKAIYISPNFAEVHNRVGIALQEQGELGEAVASHQKAIAIRPDYADAYCNLGVALKDQGELDRAVLCFRKAISIKPDYAEAHNNLGIALKDQGELDEAILCLKKAISIKSDFVRAHSNLLFVMNYGDCEPNVLFNEHKLWNDSHAAHLQMHRSTNSIVIGPEECLRIGFVSGDLCKHSVSFFLEPLFIAHNRRKLAFYCYSNSDHEDEVTTRLRSMVEGWKNIVGQDDQAVTEAICSDHIDILVDLSGHTKDNRLMVFARKPAPVQVTWLGYPNTTGLVAIDYRLTDHIADPPGQSEQLCVEQLFRLANGFLCYRPPDDAPDIIPLPMKTNGYVTFVSFNNLSKVTPKVIKIWAKILKAVPGSKLLIKCKSLVYTGVRRRYLSIFRREFIDSDRLQLLDSISSSQDHLAKYGQADIGLDSFPYNGTTTTCEALWMGVPIIALSGDRHASRVGASLLTQAGLGSLIAEDVDSYIEKAVALANDVSRLEDLRNTMRTRIYKSALCDSEGFAKNMEQAFLSMWKQRSDALG